MVSGELGLWVRRKKLKRTDAAVFVVYTVDAAALTRRTHAKDSVGHLDVIGTLYDSYRLLHGNAVAPAFDLLDFHEASETTCTALLRVRDEPMALKLRTALLLRTTLHDHPCAFAGVRVARSLQALGAPAPLPLPA